MGKSSRVNENTLIPASSFLHHVNNCTFMIRLLHLYAATEPDSPVPDEPVDLFQ
jgi:hypothetical protein